MRPVFRYLSEYIRGLHPVLTSVVTVFTAMLIILNYRFGIDQNIARLPGFLPVFWFRYLVFLSAFLVPYIATQLITGKPLFARPAFLLLAFAAPAFFAMKTAIHVDLPLPDAVYWNRVIYWPLLLMIMLVLLFITARLHRDPLPLYGFTRRNLDLRPYGIMLLIMIPLIALASTQPDFLQTYPKLQRLAGELSLAEIPGWKKLLFELSYGSDFISIELFFRGFLILAFLRYAGKDAILPMACFYCTIHFGKPLGECISSYFGGILLGVLVYHTRSVLGGLVVHLGIAWLMEIGGFAGNSLLR